MVGRRYSLTARQLPFEQIARNTKHIKHKKDVFDRHSADMTKLQRYPKTANT